MNDVKIVVYDDKRGKLRWKFIAGNGEQVARSSRGYDCRSDMLLDLAHIVDENHDAELYRDSSSGWRWRFRRDGSGSIVAMSSGGYKNKADCKSGSDLLLDAEL